MHLGGVGGVDVVRRPHPQHAVLEQEQDGAVGLERRGHPLHQPGQQGVQIALRERRLDDLAERPLALVRLRRPPLELRPFRHVDGEPEHLVHVARAVLQRPQRDQQVDHAAVTPAMAHRRVVQRRAAQRRNRVVGHDAAALLVEQRHGAAQRLGSGPAVELFGGRVPERRHSPDVERVHRQRGGLDQRLHPFAALLAGLEQASAFERLRGLACQLVEEHEPVVAGRGRMFERERDHAQQVAELERQCHDRLDRLGAPERVGHREPAADLVAAADDDEPPLEQRLRGDDRVVGGVDVGRRSHQLGGQPADRHAAQRARLGGGRKHRRRPGTAGGGALIGHRPGDIGRRPRSGQRTGERTEPQRGLLRAFGGVTGMLQLVKRGGQAAAQAVEGHADAERQERPEQHDQGAAQHRLAHSMLGDDDDEQHAADQPHQRPRPSAGDDRHDDRHQHPGDARDAVPAEVVGDPPEHGESQLDSRTEQARQHDRGRGALRRPDQRLRPGPRTGRDALVVSSSHTPTQHSHLRQPAFTRRPSPPRQGRTRWRSASPAPPADP